MLSLLSGQVPRSSSRSLFKVSGDRRGRNLELSKVHQSNCVGSHLTAVNLLILCLLVAGTSIQCNGAKNSEHAMQNWKPCICNSTFYKYCPEASDCIENNIENLSKMSKQPNSPNQIEGFLGNVGELHDNMHPDHVDDITPAFGPQNFNRNQNLGGDIERIIRHRKVYVAARKQQKPRIQTLSIRIPLEIPTSDSAVIPEPKSMYKLKKYTTYENRPEIQMVPVTKTIIKPVGVSQDQYITDSVTSSMVAGRKKP